MAVKTTLKGKCIQLYLVSYTCNASNLKQEIYLPQKPHVALIVVRQVFFYDFEHMFTVTKVTEGNVHQTGVVGLPDKK